MAKKLNLYKTVKGESVPVTAKEAKEFIMKQRGWTAEQYKKQYDIFKNKLRNYENYQRAHGVNVVAQSPTELLYKQAKTMKREGTNYEESFAMKRIKSFASVSSGTSKRQLEAYKQGKSIYYSHKKYIQGKRGEYTAKDISYREGVVNRFKGLLDGPKANKVAIEIEERIKDPVKLEQALTDLANKLHAREDKQGNIDSNSPFDVHGQSLGSTDAIDFDINSYID